VPGIPLAALLLARLVGWALAHGPLEDHGPDIEQKTEGNFTKRETLAILQDRKN